MPLSGATIRAALTAVGAVGSQMRSMDDLAAGATAALLQAPPGLTAAGAASFLATAAQESDYFRTVQEYGGPSTRYAPFFGRTFVQLTWEANYRGFGAWCKAHGLVDDPQVFARNPAALSDYRWAWLGAVFYFEVNNIWPLANRGNHLAVSQGVNGGMGTVGSKFVPAGWDARNKMFGAFLAAGDALLPGRAPAPIPPKGDNEMLIELEFSDDPLGNQPNPRGLFFRGAVDTEVGTAIGQSWVRWGAKWGALTQFRTVAWDAVKPIKEPTGDDYRGDFWTLPAGIRSLTVEGKRSTPNTLVTARLIEKMA